MKFDLRKQYYRMSLAARTSIWFTICNFLQRGSAVITVPIFTRLLTTGEYGICNIYFAWFEIFVLFTSLKLPYEGLNNGLIRYEKEKDRYTSAVLGLIMTMTMVVGTVYVVLRRPINRITGLSSSIMFLMFVQLLLNPSLMLWINRERFDFRYRIPVIVTLISTILNPVAAILAVLHAASRAEARIVGSVLVQAAFGLLAAVWLLRKGKCFYKKEYWRFALKFNLPLLFYYISQSLLNQSDRIMINYFEGSQKAAVYSVAYSAATIMMLLVSALNGSFGPWMYRKLKSGCLGKIRRISFLLCLLVAAATAAISAFAPDLIAILAPRDYYQAIWIVPPVSASVFFVFLYMIFASVEMYYGENRGISVISIVCSGANLVLNYIFIPACGYLAAGWTTLVCYMLLTLLHYLLMKRALKNHHVQEEVFPIRALLGLSAAVAALSFAMLGMYRLGCFRYVILLLEAAVVWCLRDQWFPILKQIRKGRDGNE